MDNDGNDGLLLCVSVTHVSNLLAIRSYWGLVDFALTDAPINSSMENELLDPSMISKLLEN